ncbi:17770_t:CDS:2 [Funneliformis geosporum]|uniref:1781_t:CDS:1 n=1 Tax=Funneliformis geosporum TaxID=1117311 RepID=A0A9W4SGK9_9GLOM|nr:1781_t:CDS:2 [Funneliformis geosporum]CAI2167199.1 17770_t:CDS:2 [Funneliformis geosporum]
MDESSFENEKATLEFGKYLEPKIEFIDAVKDALNSKDVKKFKIILEEFGQFISTEVILGGKAFIKGLNISKELFKLSSIEVSANLSTGPAVAKTSNLRMEFLITHNSKV